MKYSIEYDRKSTSHDEGQQAVSSSPHYYPVQYEPRRGFNVPSIVKTGAAFVVGAALLLGTEALAPVEFRPSTFTGTYDARVHAAVKAAELTQQAKYEAWAAQVKLSVEQQTEQYRALNQATLARYQAAYDRGKIFAEATTRLQGQYVAARITQTQATQSGDMALANLSRMFGRFQDWVEPGSGRGSYAYADNLSSQLSQELTAAVKNGEAISVEGWNTGLTSVDELQAEFAKIKPVTLPPTPRLGEEPGQLVKR